MLEALYKYAIDHELTARPGFKHKNVKYYMSFSSKGDFVGFDMVEKGAPQPLCPDLGSLANGRTKSNILVEKAEVIFDLPEKNKDGTFTFKRFEKHHFYLDSLAEGGRYDKRFQIASEGLKRNMEQIKEKFLSDPKFKGSDFIGIKVDGIPLEESRDYLEWWEEFRRRFETKRSSDRKRCFITGELTEGMKTVPPVQGLIQVGGHTKGDSFICFDKDAYRSYGFEKAENATISENAMTAVNSALADLLKKAPMPIAGAKYIHWFSEETQSDVTELLDYGFGDDGSVNDKSEELEEDEQRVRKMFGALLNRTLPEMPVNRYYMMSLSGVNGRVMIRSYDEGTYAGLCSSLRQWYEDIAIYEPGYGCRYPKLFGVYSRLLKNTGDLKKLGERIAEELSGVSPRIIASIYHGSPLPDPVAVKALAYIRSDMYKGAEDGKRSSPIPDRIACQILKAWLNRRYRSQNKEEFLIMDRLNTDSPSVAYQTGRLMALYAAIQYSALGDVGAGVTERYYTSACSSPALVLGKLATMSQYHLSKLKSSKPGSYTFFNKQLEEVSLKIGSTLPKTFSLEQQSEFALGYYFQRSQIYNSKNTEE